MGVLYYLTIYGPISIDGLRLGGHAGTMREQAFVPSLGIWLQQGQRRSSFSAKRDKSSGLRIFTLCLEALKVLPTPTDTQRDHPHSTCPM